jgi:N-acetyl-anhydromuramyl-L-alanine amidase AmpD
MTVNINWKPSPNYTAGRGGRKIIAIVNHQTGGQGPGALSWLSNPASKVSAHYLIFRDGTVYQLVRLQDTAWQAGAVDQPSWMLYDGTNPNRYTLGIEHECYPAVGGDGNLTERQYHVRLNCIAQLISNLLLWRIARTSSGITSSTASTVLTVREGIFPGNVLCKILTSEPLPYRS